MLGIRKPDQVGRADNSTSPSTTMSVGVQQQIAATAGFAGRRDRAAAGLRASMYRELAQYVAPKRKAMEVTGEEDGPLKAEMTLNAGLDSINGKTLGPPSERTGEFRDVREE
jgi:hypothetical protein